MRILMLVAVVFAFILRVSVAQAQCLTVADCEAQKAFAQSELRRFAREAAEAKATEVALVKTETAASWTATPTKTATPTLTPTSSATPTPTGTPTLGPTQTAVMVIINVVQTVPAVQAEGRAGPSLSMLPMAIAGILILGIAFLVYKRL